MQIHFDEQATDYEGSMSVRGFNVLRISAFNAHEDENPPDRFASQSMEKKEHSSRCFSVEFKKMPFSIQKLIPTLNGRFAVLIENDARCPKSGSSQTKHIPRFTTAAKPTTEPGDFGRTTTGYYRVEPKAETGQTTDLAAKSKSPPRVCKTRHHRRRKTLARRGGYLPHPPPPPSTRDKDLGHWGWRRPSSARQTGRRPWRLEEISRSLVAFGFAWNRCRLRLLRLVLFSWNSHSSVLWLNSQTLAVKDTTNPPDTTGRNCSPGIRQQLDPLRADWTFDGPAPFFEEWACGAFLWLE